MKKIILITIDCNSLRFYFDLNLKLQGPQLISKIKKFNEKREEKKINKLQENPQETPYEKLR